MGLLAKNTYNMVFTDMFMDGSYTHIIEAAKKAKSKVVVCSGFYYLDAEEHGITAVLNKPFDFNEFIDLLKKEF